MKIVVISDGKYGDRAIVNITAKFPQTELVILPEYSKNEILDDIEIPPAPLAAIKSADLLVNYHRHPDIAYELATFKIPMIQAVYNGEGFLRQIQEKFGYHVIMPSSMCSFSPKYFADVEAKLTTNSAKETFREFHHAFGSPVYHVRMRDESDVIEDVTVERGSVCGATSEAVLILRGKEVNVATLNEFAMNVRALCRESLSYMMQRTGVEENAILNHLVPLITELEKLRPDLFKKDEKLGRILKKDFPKIE